MRDRDERLVARECRYPGVVRMRVEPVRLVADTREQLAAVVGRHAERDDAGADLQPGRVAVVDVRHGLFRLAAFGLPERLADPRAELVAVGVVEPPDRLAVRRRRGVQGAVWPVGDAAVRAGRAIPGVDLPDAAGVGDVDVGVRRVACPIGHGDAGRVEAGAPACLGFGVVEQAVRDHGGRVLVAHPSILPSSGRTVCDVLEGYPPGYAHGAAAMIAARTAAERATFAQPLFGPGMWVVDVGCGPGSITLGLAPESRVTGVDRDAGQVALPRDAARRAG